MSEDAAAWDTSQSGRHGVESVVPRSVAWSWLKAFHVLPLLGACSLTGLLWTRRSCQRGPTTVAWGWGLGYPLGSFVWVGLWFLFGGASGVPEPGVIAAALTGWLGWSVGMRLAAPKRFRAIGIFVCIGSFIALVAFRVASPSGTGLIALDIEGSLIGLLPYWKACRSQARGLSDWTALFRRKSRESTLLSNSCRWDRTDINEAHVIA